MEFPRAKVGGSPYDFSFSGLKSAVLNYINHAADEGARRSACRIWLPLSRMRWWMSLVSRAVAAAKEYGYDKLAIAGGVASNSALRARNEGSL